MTANRCVVNYAGDASHPMPRIARIKVLFRRAGRRMIRKRNAIIGNAGKLSAVSPGSITIGGWGNCLKKVKERIEHLCAYSSSNTT